METNPQTFIIIFLLGSVSILVIMYIISQLIFQELSLPQTNNTISNSLQRIVKYNVNNPMFTSLSLNDKMDYTILMLNYNVDANQSLQQGRQALRERNFLSQILSLNSFALITARISGILIYVCVGIVILELFICLIAIWPLRLNKLAIRMGFALGFTLFILLFAWVMKSLYTKVEISTNEVSDTLSTT